MNITYETNEFDEQVIVKTFDDGSVIKELDRPGTVNPVPQSVSIRQACQALEEAGLLDDIEAAIAAAPRTVQIDWQRATSVDRSWPTLLAVQAQMGLTDEQIDALFVRAAQL